MNQMRPQEIAVTILGTDSDTGRIMCRDAYGNEFEIDGTLRPKAMGFPSQGERWLLARKAGGWVPDLQIGAPGLMRVEGSREGMHPVSVQILDALSRSGMVFDATIAPLAIGLDDDSDPPPEFTDPDEDQEPETPPSLPDPGTVPPKADAPKKTPKDNDPDPVRQKWVPIYFGTINIKKDLGQKRAEQDLRRFLKTRVHVVGIQEFHAADRLPILQRLDNIGWNYYRPGGASNQTENAIVWDTARLKKLDQGSLRLAWNIPGQPEPARWVNWCKFQDKATNRIFFFASTHLQPHIEGHVHGHGGPSFQPGRASIDPYYRPRVVKFREAVDNLADWMAAKGKVAPVITVGDFNMDWVAERKHRPAGFPIVKFGAVNTFANWGLIDHRPSYGTFGGRYIDQVWFTRPTHYQIRIVDHWIGTGYNTDHRPVVVKALIRSNNKN